jgi:hypothetical protein
VPTSVIGRFDPGTVATQLLAEGLKAVSGQRAQGFRPWNWRYAAAAQDAPGHEATEAAPVQERERGPRFHAVADRVAHSPVEVNVPDRARVVLALPNTGPVISARPQFIRSAPASN